MDENVPRANFRNGKPELYDKNGGIDMPALADALGVSVKVLEGGLRESADPGPERDAGAIGANAAVIASIVLHAFRTFGDPLDARRWFQTKSSDLEGLSPLDLLLSGYARVVETLLHNIDTGQPG